MTNSSDKFAKMADFISLKKNCIFCQTPLRINLSNYLGVKMNGLPVISAPLEDGLFKFQLKHTTAEFSIKADITVQPSTNIVIFDNFTNGEFPNIDAHLVKRVFEEHKPVVEVYCASRSCRSKYHLLSEPLSMIKVTKVSRAWQVLPFRLFLEGFKVKNYMVSNISPDAETFIHSLKNEDANPIKVPRMDFESMSKEKLFTRIQTLVTFS
jgi:hypothetical protein